jgi:hypothetical protein
MSATAAAKKNSVSSLHLQQRVQRILSQDRHVLNFEHYIPSPTHVARMGRLAKTVPELYDNPGITPRSKWFTHPRWHENSQMPPFHSHFRSELQSAIQALYNAYEIIIIVSSSPNHNNNNNNNKETSITAATQRRMIERANHTFRGSMQGLNGHVRIEEYACSPLYKKTFPKVDISFLYQDHQHLHESERHVYNAFDAILLSSSSNNVDDDDFDDDRKDDDDDDDSSTIIISIQKKEELASALNRLLDFDDELMAHLGEEEEIVVPMSLTEKEIWF